MELTRVIQVQDNGLSIIDFDLLEQISSMNFAKTVQRRIEGQKQKLFNASIKLMDNGYLHIRGLAVPSVYDDDWKRAVNHSNCSSIQFAYIPKTDLSNEFINYDCLSLHMFEEVGLKVQPLESEELI